MRGFRIGASLATAAAAIAAVGLMPSIGHAEQIAAINQRPSRVHRRKHVTPTYGGGGSKTTLHNANGERECARRRRQIANGSLTESNGLVR